MTETIGKQKIFPAGRLIAFCIILFVCLPAQAPAETESGQTPQMVEKSGSTIPLDLTFIDEDGNPVRLKDLVDRPTVLTLVYYRCPSICSPLLHELASAVEKCEMEPGPDYRLLTISFDKREGPDLAKIAHSTILQSMDRKIPAESWRFMTGDEENILKLTEAVGFYFMQEKEDFIHPTVVMFLSKEGKIIRYLNGLTFLPVDMQMAILDASKGRVSNVMQKIQRLCYSYDADERSYAFQINRLILFGTLFFVALFGLFLIVRGRKKSRTGGSGT